MDSLLGEELETKPENKSVDDDLFEFEEFETTQDAQEQKADDEFTEDLQKELEAKFDELFGPME